MFGNVAENMTAADLRATVAVVSSKADYSAIESAHRRLAPSFNQKLGLPDIFHAEPDYDEALQTETLLNARDRRIVAVLGGGLAKPRLTGDIGEDGSVQRRMSLILDEARQMRALEGAGLRVPSSNIEVVKVRESAGSLAAMRATTARLGQLLVFMLTLMLATMLLSNLVEEKSNKVIEILAAAVPIDAVFLGKLFSMLAISLVGLAVWTGATLAGLAIWPMGEGLPQPAVGWPLFVILAIVYYGFNYLLLGALFLGIGSQASSIREVQTLSLPVSIAQILLFLLGMSAVSQYNSVLGIGAAVFPFSSPLVMIARAAQTPELWPHLLAILWQTLWVWLTVKLAASLFRLHVMRSASPFETARRRFRRAKA
jgi:ABC-2 type transport system permease protein